MSSLLILVLTSRALAATVTLAWDANTEPNLAGYILHYGNASGSYSTEVDVGNTTMAALSGVDEGQTYYFAATAYNVNRNESTFSNEVRYTIPVDAIPPTAVMTSPSDGSSIPRKSTITMTAAASDNVGVVRVEFYANGQLQCADGSASSSCAWKVPPRMGRTYQLQAKAFDAHGNVGASSIVTVTSR